VSFPVDRLIYFCQDLGPMVSKTGRIVEGNGHFSGLMTRYREIFERAVGQALHAGTLNVRIDTKIAIKEEFRISGADIGEPDQDLLFEKCRINGIDAYRLRPYNLQTGRGGHGDETLEIVTQFIPNAKTGVEVEITFFRDLT
jgi:CTP-dependent riboflavin kinase